MSARSVALEHTIVIDTREPEHTAWSFGDTPTVRRTLKSGDYSIEGFENEIAIERKELGDLVSSLVANRERFFRELERLSQFRRALVVIEGDLEDVLEHRYRSKVSPACLLGSLASVFGRWNIASVFCGSKRGAQVLAKVYLLKSAKYASPALEVAS